MAVTPKTIASWGLLGPDPGLVEGMDITLTTDAALEAALETDEITVEIDEG
jgi:hypothetical protein